MTLGITGVISALETLELPVGGIVADFDVASVPWWRHGRTSPPEGSVASLLGVRLLDVPRDHFHPGFAITDLGLTARVPGSVLGPG
jgi:hypothetical protein